MKVLKFGGSSVANATNMSRVLDIAGSAASTDRIILVSSAISGCTDRLIALSALEDRSEAIEELKSAHTAIVRRLFSGGKAVLDRLEAFFTELSAAPAVECLTYGELFSTTILAAKLAEEGWKVKWLDSRDLISLKQGKLDKEITYGRIGGAIDKETRIFVAPGFIARDEKGRPTDLGRGGSDYSAAIFAAAAKASELQIWTDVPGIMTCNPKDVSQACTVPDMTYEAAFALAAHGAKVLYPPTVIPAGEAGIPIRILNSFDTSAKGTVISSRVSAVERWIGVTSSGVGDNSVISLVGESVSSMDAAARRIGRALSEAGISVAGSFSGDGPCTLTIPVRSTVEKVALRAIHKEFFEHSSVAVTDVYIAGFGAVGKALAALIPESAGRIAERRGRSIRIAGIANSDRWVINTEGIPPEDAARLLSEAAEQSGSFVDAVLSRASSRSVFIDCTDSCDIHSRFADLFRQGIGVVTSNRRSLAVPLAEYRAMKRSARENGVMFRYDTTVGTALPILESIAAGTECTDEITCIDAVISCTINNILSNYDGPRTESLASLLRRSQNEGLTEYDPRVDLGGKDVLRKLLIIAREAGVPLEEEDVKLTPMLPEKYFDCSLDEFYRMLEDAEPEFIARENELDEKGRRQRFVASLHMSGSGYSAEICMREVDEDDPFFRLKGTENIIRVESRNGAPLVIRGAGEGAAGAAAGILNDILK